MPRWVYTHQGLPLPEPVEVGADWTSAPQRAQVPTEELTYGGMRATDGADISSRKKHRAYMKRNNLTTIDDFKGQSEKNRARLEQVRKGGTVGQNKDRREAIGRAMYQLEQRGRR